MTLDEIIEMARQTLSRDIGGLWLAGTEDLEDFAELVAAKEREACAKVCYELMLKDNPYNQWKGQNLCMEAIRARGEA